MSKPSFPVAVNSVNADGTTVLTPVDVSVDPKTGGFEMQLPNYVVEGTNVEGPMLYADTLQGVVHAYEQVCDEYSRERLGIKAEPKLMLTWRNYVSTGAQHFGLQQQIGIGITEVFVVGDALYRRNGTVMGQRMRGEFVAIPQALLDDTPEVRAKYEELAESIRTAGTIFEDFYLAANPTDYFLKIASAESESAPSDGPLADGWQISVKHGHAGYGVYAHMTEYPEEGAVLLQALPAPTTNPEDEEL